MSTNKRKEAAALFELLDKSTLKVPKGGSLKIPAWWSSKTNPAPTAPPPPANVPSMPAPRPAAHNAPATPPAHPPAPAPAPQPSPQHKLFDPPPADAPPALSPSIRPPVAPPATPPAPLQPPAEPPTRTTLPVSEEELQTDPVPAPRPNTADSGRRVFAPKTYDPSAANRRTWINSQKGLFARTPPWAVLTAGAAVLALLLLFLFLFIRHHNQSPVATTGNPAIDLKNASGSSFAQDRGGSQPLVPPSPANGGSLLPPAQPRRTPILQENTAPDRTSERAVEENTDTTEGKVYAPGTVDRDPKLLYIIIASTPQDDIAQRNAQFIAKNGVDVSIETLKNPRGRSTMYTLISVKGFPTLSEAEAYRKRIVQIGHKTLDFQKYRKAWDDAYATHVKSLSKESK